MLTLADSIEINATAVAVIGGGITIIIALIKFGDRLWGGKKVKDTDTKLSDSLLKLFESLSDYTHEVQQMLIRMDERERISETRHQELIRLIQQQRSKQ